MTPTLSDQIARGSVRQATSAPSVSGPAAAGPDGYQRPSKASERYGTCNRLEQIRLVAHKTLHRQGKGRQTNPWGWIIVAIAMHLPAVYPS